MISHYQPINQPCNPTESNPNPVPQGVGGRSFESQHYPQNIPFRGNASFLIPSHVPPQKATAPSINP